MTRAYCSSFYVSRTAYTSTPCRGHRGQGVCPWPQPRRRSKNDITDLQAIYPSPANRLDGVGWIRSAPTSTRSRLVNWPTRPSRPQAYPSRLHRPPPRPAHGLSGNQVPQAKWKTWISGAVTFPGRIRPPRRRGPAPVPRSRTRKHHRRKKGLQPDFVVRKRGRRAPLHTRASGNLLRPGQKDGPYEMAFESIEDIWKFQLDGTACHRGFRGTGMVPSRIRRSTANSATRPSRPHRENRDKQRRAGKRTACRPWPPTSLPSVPRGPYGSPSPGGCSPRGIGSRNPLLTPRSPKMCLDQRDRGKKLGSRTAVRGGVRAGHGGRQPSSPVHPPEAVFLVQSSAHLPEAESGQGQGVATTN
jgi:thiosulfate reductase/polysulfide reductase chain A